MILGDFNAHCTMWGSEKTDYRGKIIEKILENENIVILNDTSPTHINLANGNLSCIDLTMCTSSLAQRLKWKVLPDIYSTAEISIGSCINHNKNPKVPLWNDEIKRAIFNKKSALNTYKKNKTLENFIQLKKLRAQAKFLPNFCQKKSKKNSWKEFTTSTNSKTNSSKIWNKIHSLKGLNRNQDIHISDDQGTTSSLEDVAEKIGAYLQDNFSNKIYKQKFIDGIKTPTENLPIISMINPNNSDQIDLNSSITLNEMETALNKCQRKSLGPDSIPYCFIINLGKTAKTFLLNIYNNIWHTGVIPKEWKKGIIIPILKPGKNKHSTEGYRPITLLNTMTKIMEKIINSRLIWFLEKNKILSKEQSGFRHTRSTMDNLITIKTEIENAFEHKQILGMISLDITKAYDTVWRYRILTLLSKILTNGNMFMYITNFLKERPFQVKVSHTLSKTFCQENGIPQGSSLAVTLFLLAINDIVETIKVPVKANLFADDFNIFCRSNNLKTVQELLQISANSLSDW
ncbi:hypothetical protein QTP88_015260 [Uroleucon formosanum]